MVPKSFKPVIHWQKNPIYDTTFKASMPQRTYDIEHLFSHGLVYTYNELSIIVII